MSQSSTLTRCPHCDTRFRVTEEQLGIARGKVRCGNCMEVFNALEHSEPDTDSTPSAKRQPPPTTPDGNASGSGKFMDEEEFIFEDDPEEDAAEGNYAGTKTSFEDDELSDSFLSFDETKDNGFTDPEDDHAANIDESWAEAILDENETDRTFSSRSRPVAPEPEPEPEPNDNRDEPFSQRRSFEAPQPEPEAPRQRPIEQETPAFDSDLPDFAMEESADDGLRARDDEPEDPLAATRRMGTGTPYHELRSEPVAINRSGRSGLRRTLWTLVILLLVGILVSQVTYFQLDRLSSIPELRPYYEQGCDILDCELPPLVAIDRIQSQKLVVRTDPKQRDTLVVDAVLLNQAGFEQPFPNIGLTFSNLNGDVVAQSLFEPDEYLSGDAQQMEMMPSRTPVRISIHIRDPGRDAVNYNLTFIARSK